MKDMIEALQIFLSYMDEDKRWPFVCEHDVLYVHGAPSRSQVSDEHAARLDEIGFMWDDDLECWFSYRYGSC